MIDKKIYKELNIGINSKMYKSNIGYIIISDKKDYVYKIFTNIDLYKKEKYAYNLLENKVLIPKNEDLGKIFSYYILKLENVRKEFKRKENIEDLGLGKVAKLLKKIYSINKDGKTFLLGDIHESNFFERKISNSIELGIFDFSSSKYGDIEEDLANLYIDLDLSDRKIKKFISFLEKDIDYSKLYKYTIKELYERIKNGMNLDSNRKNKYISFLVILKNKGIKT